MEKLEGEKTNVKTWFSHIPSQSYDEVIASSTLKEQILIPGPGNIGIIIKKDRQSR